MKTATSVSGGRSSAYVAANYPADYLVFALVRIEDRNCLFPDAGIRRIVEDRIQKPFIATAEDDIIIYTILDLEQYLGRAIDWVSGETFDETIRSRGRKILPSWHRRFCTQYMKVEPIFNWWAEKIGEPVQMQIGYRANEGSRIAKMLRRCNPAGLMEYKACVGTHQDGPHAGKRKWRKIAWQMPTFPLFDGQVFPAQIHNFWEGRQVRFAPRNNCIGCFHRHPMLLKKMAEYSPKKMDWFSSQEKLGKGTWRTGIEYETIINYPLQMELSFDEFSRCDDGYCGL